MLKADIIKFCACGCGQYVKSSTRTFLQGHHARVCHPNFRHGRSNSGEYASWGQMLQRCTNPNNPAWNRYGGKGITVCEKWKSFDNFFDDMGPRPATTSIDRIDNDGNYEPGNCRWATREQQQINRRNTIKITHQNKTLSLVEWSKITGLSRDLLYNRRRHGDSPERMFRPHRYKQPKVA